MKWLSTILSNKFIKKFISTVIAILIFYFLFSNIFKNFNIVTNSLKHFNSYSIFLIFATTLTLHILNIFSWHYLTKFLKLKIGFFENSKIWMLPNLSRYIPGTVWQYLGRAYLLKKNNINKNTSFILLALDALMTFSLGCFVLLISMVFFGFPIKNYFYLLPIFVIFPILIVSLLKNNTLLSFFVKYINIIFKRKFKSPNLELDIKMLLTITIFTTAQFLVAGICLFLITFQLQTLDFKLLPIFAGIYSASWILGYISFFAPGGLGIQEISISGLLSLFIPLPLASISAIIFRVMLIVSELTISLFIYTLSLRIKKSNF